MLDVIHGIHRSAPQSPIGYWAFQSHGPQGSSWVVVPLGWGWGGRRAGNTCWVPCLCFSPRFRLPRHFSPKSVTAFSFICVSIPLPSPCVRLSSLRLHPSVSPSLLPCIPAQCHALPLSRLCPIRGVTAAELSKHSPQVLPYLYINALSLWHCGAGAYQQKTLCLQCLQFFFVIKINK